MCRRTDPLPLACSELESCFRYVVAECLWLNLSGFSFIIREMRTLLHQVVVRINEIMPNKK